MLEPELFHKSVGVLVNALEQGTLRSNTSCGCAVGNLVAAACGYDMQPNSFGFAWRRADGILVTPTWFGALLENIHNNSQIVATGYTFEEIMDIEGAFEGCKSVYEKSDRYMSTNKRLSAVYDELCRIHEVTAEDLLGENPFEPKKEVIQVAELVTV